VARPSYPAPTRADHRRFCEIEGWSARGTASRKGAGDHLRFELTLPDGRILYTRVSHPVNRQGSYGKSLWKHILKDQLDVTEAEFWACVREGVKPSRGERKPAVQDAVPVGVVIALVEEFHLVESEVRAMTRSEAIARLAKLYTEAAAERAGEVE